MLYGKINVEMVPNVEIEPTTPLPPQLLCRWMPELDKHAKIPKVFEFILLRLPVSIVWSPYSPLALAHGDPRSASAGGGGNTETIL